MLVRCIHDHDIFTISAAADSSLSLTVNILGGVLGSLLLIALLIIVGLIIIILLLLKKQSESKQ